MQGVPSLQLKTFFCSPVLHVRIYKNYYSRDVCSLQYFLQVYLVSRTAWSFPPHVQLPAGLQACQLALSARTVWARCPNGDVARRYGITDKNPAGDYWKKIPGNVSRLTGKLVLHHSLSKTLWCLLWALPDGAQDDHMQGEPHTLCFTKGVFITLVKTFSGYNWENRSKYCLFSV